MNWRSGAEDSIASVVTAPDNSTVIHVEIKQGVTDLPPNVMPVEDFFAAFKDDADHQERVRAARVELSETLPQEGRSQLSTMRLRQGLSQADLAAVLETSQSRISRIESSREEPGIRFAGKMADALGVTLDELLQAFETSPNGSNGGQRPKDAPHRARAAG